MWINCDFWDCIPYSPSIFTPLYPETSTFPFHSKQTSYCLCWTWTISNFFFKICQNFSLKISCYIIKSVHRSCLFINIIWRQYPSSGRSLIISLFNDYNLYNYESYISYLKNAISNWLRGLSFLLDEFVPESWCF